MGQTDWCFGKTGGIKKLRYLFDFAYRNVFCKGANVGLGHWEGGASKVAASSLTKKAFLASAGGI